MLKYFIVFVLLASLFAPSALSTSSLDPWPGIEQKLEENPNTFSINQPFSLTSSADATTNYANAKSYIAVDMASGQILAEKNSTTAFPIASLTKIMSAVVALDLMKPTDEVTISSHAARMSPTKIGVVPGEKMTVDELLRAMLMTSANDAAQAMADGVNAKYKQDIFVAAMREKAKLLHLSGSYFTNPEGFDIGHNKSSAHDLAVLSVYALSHYPVIADIVQTQYMQLPANSFHKQFDLYNWNGLLGVYPGVTGMKIGNTNAAGYTTVVSATRQGHTILAVLLGAPGILERDEWASSLLDTSFAFFGIDPARIVSFDLLQKYSTWQYWN